jgi:cytochrome c oxidase subunit 4
MTAQAEDVQHHAGPSYIAIWVYLLVLTGVEVILAYKHIFSVGMMLVVLMLLSLVKAALIVAYFMHLRFEKASLIVTIVPTVVVVISLLAVFFPDSFRLFDLRVR